MEVVQKGTCRNPLIMDLVRKLFFICALFAFEVSCVYINTKSNDVADSLSRLQFDRFMMLVPDADVNMTYPVIV